MRRKINAYWGNHNVGDELTPLIIRHFTPYEAEWVPTVEAGKLLLGMSVLEYALPGDTVIGSGTYQEAPHNLEGVRVLALRGRLSGEAPLYGAPALLMPLIYNPKIPKLQKVGYVPHLWDRQDYKEYIDVDQNWRSFINHLKQCEHIVTTSLHGAILAIAYGIPYEWVESKRVPGAKIKYEDFLTGIEDGVEVAQQNILKALAQL